MASDHEVVERLDRIAKLMALSLISEMETDDKRRTLAAVGYNANEIAILLHEKSDTIQKFLKREREAAKSNRRRTPTAKARGR